MDQKITNNFDKIFLAFESIGRIGINILLCSIYMDSVILLSVLSFSDGLNLLKEFGASVILSLFVLERSASSPTVLFSNSKET